MFKVDILAYAGRSHATATWDGGGAGGVRRGGLSRRKPL